LDYAGGKNVNIKTFPYRRSPLVFHWNSRTPPGQLDEIRAGLEENPELGRIGRIATTRELILNPLPFALAYRVRRSRIDILALLHGARKWPERM